MRPSEIQTYGIAKPAWAPDNPGDLDSHDLTRLQLHYDRKAFADRLVHDRIGRVQLFQKIADTLVPGWFEWHSWTLGIVEALCWRRWCALSGCSGSAKTRNVAGFSAIWWLCAPEYSSVIFCSTTMKMLRKRGWAEIQSIHQAVGSNFGNFVDSRTTWQYQQGDDRHAIFGLAVNEGNGDTAAANIQGVHTRRQMIAIDEAEAVRAAIWKASANLYSYPIDNGGEFIMVAVANPRSRLSQYGRFIEPENGWESVGVDTDTWESKPQLDGKKALVFRLDFKKSPNVTEGKTVSKHLPTKARVENRIQALKDKGAENDPDHWCYDRGFPPPEGLSKTVFTESLILAHNGYGQHVFTGNNWTIIGAFDQAFGGGDRPALRFAALGDIAADKMGIELMPPIEIFVDANSSVPARYQLLHKLREACSKVKYRGSDYVCLPENLAIDVTGEGGLADICEREWSPKIIRIQFSGAASQDQCSNEDPRIAKDVYRNKRAEMYFQSLNSMMAGQLKGIDKDTAAELTTIEYDEYRPDGTKKLITIQDKKEYKSKFTKSPDYGDCACMIQEVARLKGFRIVQIGHTIVRFQEFDQLAERSNAVYDEITYSASNDDDMFEAIV